MRQSKHGEKNVKMMRFAFMAVNNHFYSEVVEFYFLHLICNIINCEICDFFDGSLFY